MVYCLGKIQKPSREKGLWFYRWSSGTDLYSYSELFRPHRSFGHTSVSALYSLLSRAGPYKTSADVKQAIGILRSKCQICSELGSKPRRLKMTVGSDGYSFNHAAALNIMHSHKRPVLHVVDETTHFAAANFLRNSSLAEKWKALPRCWSHVYLCLPDYSRLIKRVP